MKTHKVVIRTVVEKLIPAMSRPETIVLAVAMAFISIGWVQWVHVGVFASHDATTGGHIVHWLRDAALAVPLALLALGSGQLIAERLATPVTSGGGRLLWQALLTSLVFGALLTPMVAVHAAIDGWLGGGGLGSLRPAPGAGYLEVLARNGFEASDGFFGVLAHGGRDGIIALAAAGPVVLIGLIVVAASAQRTTARVMASQTQLHTAVSRRDAIRYGTAGAAAFALSSSGVILVPAAKAHAATTGDMTPWIIDNIELFMNGGTKQMIDGADVYMLGYGFTSAPYGDDGGLHTPGPVIWTYEGQTVRLGITNNLPTAKNFKIDGIVDSGLIAPGARVEVSFAAPAAGTYMYEDTSNSFVNRVLGLQGTMIVMPANGDMILSPQLNASYWTYHSQWVWMFNEIDPAFNEMAEAGQSIDPLAMINGFAPRYFTINGRMGSLAAHEETAPDTVIHAHIGEPALIRVVNGGLCTHSPHIHGNHVYVLTTNGGVLDTIMWKDTVMMKPTERKDIFLPYAIPPNAVHWPPPQSGQKFLEELHGQKMEGKWPMHCHVEMSQTAGGGFYPQGLLTDWKIEI